MKKDKQEKQVPAFGKAALSSSQGVADVGVNVVTADAGAPLVPEEVKPKKVKPVKISVERIKLEQAADVVQIGADEVSSPSD